MSVDIIFDPATLRWLYHIPDGLGVQFAGFTLQQKSSYGDCPALFTMSRVATSSGHLFFAFPVRRRPTCACTLLPPPPRHLYPDVTLKPFSTCPSIQQDDLATTASEQPRWKAPPLRMVSQGASNRSFRPQPPKPFSVNEDPKRLDHVFERVLGEDGDEMLTDEVKWLTVTHKSFDHGRRGFNDRLAYLGTFGHIPLISRGRSLSGRQLQARESLSYELH